MLSLHLQFLSLYSSAKKFDYENLCRSLHLLSDFEKRANSRVIDSGMLEGANLDDVKRAGERLILQTGCASFFQRIVSVKEKFNVDLHVLSYCWCGDLIRSAFSSGTYRYELFLLKLFLCFFHTQGPYLICISSFSFLYGLRGPCLSVSYILQIFTFF